MTHPSPSLLDAIAEICKWHSRVELTNPSRKLRDGGRQAILPPEIPDAIRKGEIEVPEELIWKIEHAVIDGPPASIDSVVAQMLDERSGETAEGHPRERHPPGAVD